MVIPGLVTVRSYQPAWLSKDIVAGLVLASLLIPQGMAYAELAGLPPITGLYTSIMCLLAYAVFGPSRILVLGPDSSLGPMIAATILPLMAAGGDPTRAVALASILALMVGAFMILGAVARLGFIADLLSQPTQIGYLNGLALTIFVGQLPKLFGFSTDANGLVGEAIAFVQGVAAGNTVPAALAIGLFGLVVMLVLQRRMPTVPGVLIAVVASMVVVFLFDLGSRGVDLVGVLPSGLPPLTIPRVEIRTSRYSSAVRSASPSSRWPTRSRRRRRSRVGPGRTSTPTRRWSASARPTSQRACSRAFRSARVPHGARSPSGQARRPS